MLNVSVRLASNGSGRSVRQKGSQWRTRQYIFVYLQFKLTRRQTDCKYSMNGWSVTRYYMSPIGLYRQPCKAPTTHIYSNQSHRIAEEGLVNLSGSAEIDLRSSNTLTFLLWSRTRLAL